MLIKELYRSYLHEFQSRLGDGALTPQHFAETVGPILAGLRSVETDGARGKGVLYYRTWEEGRLTVCDIPVYGYYASSDRALIELFSRLSAELVRKGSTRFQFHCYTHDPHAQEVFSMLQFGYMAEKGCFRIDPLPPYYGAEYAIRTLEKAEIEARWPEIRSMITAILSRLQEAPIFYPCEEFTEAGYRDLFLAETTRLHVAFDEADRLIGMVETNEERAPLLGSARTANIGEIYVAPGYRGTGLSDALFLFAAAREKEKGAAWLWVEHGTANPNARAFWGRYFDSYEYELDRTVERIPEP